MAGAGGVRVSIALDQSALATSPTFTDITELVPNLVAGYDLSRGRQYELDFTDTGSYSITIKDRNGLMDVTNTSSPLWNELRPDLQVLVELWNPVAATWSTRARLWIEDFDYDLDPSDRLLVLKLTCYDIFALLSRIQMQPGQFGVTPPGAALGGRDGVIFFDNQTFKDRIDAVLVNALGATAADVFAVTFTGNVNLLESLHSPGETPMDVIQLAVDGEFPGVSNVYPDRRGRCVAHGRLAKFAAETTWESIDADVTARNLVWAFRHWKIGDAAAVAGAPADYARLVPPFSWNDGSSKIINDALAYPKGIKDADIAGQHVEDTVSKGLHGYGSWSKENLLTENGILTGNDGNAETKAFAQFHVNNYAQPIPRITALSAMTIPPNRDEAAQTWDQLCNADVADRIDVTVGHPGGGGFNLEPFFIEGVRETAEPHNGEYALVRTSYDVSPMAHFTGDLAGLDGGG